MLKAKVSTSNPQMSEEEYLATKKLYVLVDESLPATYAGVQAGHAAIDFCIRYPDLVNDWNENHNVLIYLQASRSQMDVQQALYAKLDKTSHAFVEPDLGDVVTAVAFEPVTNEEGLELFKGFRLLR